MLCWLMIRNNNFISRLQWHNTILIHLTLSISTTIILSQLLILILLFTFLLLLLICALLWKNSLLLLLVSRTMTSKLIKLYATLVSISSWNATCMHILCLLLLFLLLRRLNNIVLFLGWVVSWWLRYSNLQILTVNLLTLFQFILLLQ